MSPDLEMENQKLTEQLFFKHISETVEDIDADNWKGHEAQIESIFGLYKEVINPLISIYNSLENSFPIGVINELRNVFSHLTLSLQEKDHSEINRHLDKAQRHLKRAAIDAFKYACMAFSNVYDDFKESYKNVDLGYVDNGKLLPDLAKLNAQAENSMHRAKMIESSVHEVEEMYAAYELAFNSYVTLYNRVLGAMEAAEVIKLKEQEKEKKEKRQRYIDRIIAIVGVIIGIIGLIIGFF